MTNDPRLVAAPALDRLGAWARRKPRVALMGEFSSGKSTLLNLLIGEDLLPTRVTATELPPVWFGYGTPRAFWVDRKGTRHPLGFGEFGGVPRSARYVRVFTPAPFLERCDVIDTPGISDPNLEDESWRFPVGQASFVLWCTPATQAWRETERSTWLSLPARLRANSVLVITRADKLAPGDREKVGRRLARESLELFAGQVFLSSTDAMRGQALLRDTGDAGAWQRSGGAELVQRIDAGVAAVRAHRLDLLGRYRLGEGAPVAPQAPLSAAPIAVAPSFVAPASFAPPPSAPAPLAPPPFAAGPSAFAFAAEDPAPPVRLVAPPDPVRPRRVELPDSPRTERPAIESDPLNEIRTGWMALRSNDGERPAPAAVLRLPDPVPREEHGEEPPHRPEEPSEADLLGAVAASLAAEVPAEEVPPEQALRPEAPPSEAPAAELPRAVRLWRAIVAASPENPQNGQIVAMIDQLLSELSRDDELSGATDASAATIIGRTRAA